jgi:glycosyltransferase involved in cell wall biosynthesis
MQQDISIIIPAKNEHASLRSLLPALRKHYPDAEIIVVNDGSTDDTAKVCRVNEVKLLSHPYCIGNGAAIKSGARASKGSTLVFMDADGQHNPDDIPKLLAQIDNGYDMAVGARDGHSQATIGRWWANSVYNKLATWMVGQRVADLTSGFRAVNAKKFKEFLHILPNGFSYPTTITMSFFRAGYSLCYVPIQTEPRVGKSHIRPLRDGIRFLIIIFRIGTLYSPLKLFLPFSMGSFLLGVSYYAYTLHNFGRFTNMSALLFITSILIFLIGLVSEQITMLIYKDSGK